MTLCISSFSIKHRYFQHNRVVLVIVCRVMYPWTLISMLQWYSLNWIMSPQCTNTLHKYSQVGGRGALSSFSLNFVVYQSAQLAEALLVNTVYWNDTILLTGHIIEYDLYLIIFSNYIYFHLQVPLVSIRYSIVSLWKLYIYRWSQC